MALAPELVGLLASGCLVLLLMMLSFGYTYTLGALLRLLAGILNVGIDLAFTTVHPFAFLAGEVTSLDNTIRHGFGVGIEAAQYGFNKCMQALAYTFQEIGNGIEGLAGDTLDALTYLRRVAVPTLIRVTIGPLAALIAWQAKQIIALGAAIGHVVAHPGRLVTTTINNTKVVERTVTKTVTVTIPAAITRAVAIPLPRIGRLEREVSGLEKWVKSHLGVLGIASLAGLGVAALEHAGIGWARCSKVNRLGKMVCGLDESVLEGLIAGALIIASSISIVELAQSAQGFTAEVEGPLRQFVRELRDAHLIGAPDAHAELAAYAAGNF